MFKYGKTKKSKLSTARRRSKVIASGVECIYIQMSKTTAYKCYPSRREASDALKRQKLAHRHGIGPKVLSPVLYYNSSTIENELDKSNYDIPDDWDGDTVGMGWAYKTQVVRTLDGDNIKLDDRGIEILMDKAEKAGFPTNDLHEWNLGKIGRRYVMIDFGDVSAKKCTY